MKRILPILLFFSVFSVPSFGQIKIDDLLSQKLEGKTKFQDIKSTVWSHLTEKLAAVDSKDSVGRKAILRQMKMWNRQFWISEYYTNEKGEVEPQSKVIMNALTTRNREKPKEGTRGQTEGWVQNGPISSEFSLFHGEGVGRIDRLAFHPTQANIMFAGSPHGGLFKTTNSGEEWFPISEYNASLGVSGIAVNPNNPDIIYVLSGDGDSSPGSFVDRYLYLSPCNGVYKTINGGQTWQKLPNFPDIDDNTSYRGRSLIIDPNDQNKLYAATDKGLFTTTDGGNSWIHVIQNQNIWDVKLKPGNSNYVYCVGDNFFKRSTDGGISFLSITIPEITPAARISMAVTPANPSKIALLAGASGSDGSDCLVGVFISNDSGGTFDLTYDDNDDNLFYSYIDLNSVLNQTTYNNVIAISPLNENIILAGGLCLWRSEDGGNTWSQETAYWATSDVLHEYIHPDQHFLAYHPISNKLYTANDGGVYVSENNGDDFDFIETGLSTSQFYHFEEEDDEDDTWGGTQDNGVIKRGDGNEFIKEYGGDGYDVMTDHPSRCESGESNDVYFTVNQKIFTDGFAIGGYEEISVPNNNFFFGNLAMHPTDEDIIYVGYQGGIYKREPIQLIYIWGLLGNQIPGNWAVCAGKNHTERLYASGTDYNTLTGIWRWDDTDTWTSIFLPAPYQTSQKITDIEIDRLNDDHVYVSCGGATANSKVYASDNAGASWTNISFNLPNVPIFCLLRDPSGGLYAGTSIGVYYKRANQNHWEPFYNSLPPVPVTQIVFEEEESIFVHCSTFGRGLWRTLKYNTDCVEDRNMTGTVRGRNYWEASNIITSTQIIEDSPGTKIIYNAGNQVILSPGPNGTIGFHAKKGSEIKIVTTGCGGQVDLSKPTNIKPKNKKQSVKRQR